MNSFKNMEASALKSYIVSIKVRKKIKMLEARVENKVENIVKGSPTSIPSPIPSGKIQIMGRKGCLRSNGKKFLGVDNTQQSFASLPQVKFPANNLNFHCR